MGLVGFDFSTNSNRRSMMKFEGGHTMEIEYF